MKCEPCQGIGELLIDGEGNPVSRLRDAITMIPCPYCGGSGTVHCKEGAGMICENCNGKGRDVHHISPNGIPIELPWVCLVCGGTGITHCCEGDRACPETDRGGTDQCRVD